MLKSAEYHNKIYNAALQKSTMLDTLMEAAGGVTYAWTGARDRGQNNKFYMIGSGVRVKYFFWFGILLK